MNDVEAAETTPSTPSEVPHRWDPFTELEAWARRFDRRGMRWPDMLSAFDGVDFTPLADVEETDTAWTIEVELPGIKKKEVQLEAHGRTVVISGERKEKARQGVLRQRKRVTGSFRYEVTLGAELDAEAIEAKLVDGVLTITVPKADQDQPHKIKIG